MADRIPQSTSYELAFKAFLTTTGAEATGQTVAITISKDGATSFSNPSGGATNATEIGSGWYFVVLTTTDTGTLGRLAVRGTSVTINDFGQALTVIDATTGGATNLDAAISSRASSTALDIVQSDIDSRLPVALIGGRMDASIGAVASGAVAAASFATGALDAVWSTATRLLTAGTNIVLAKGTGVTGLNDLSAAQVNTEADTALADVGLTTTITGRVDAAVSTRLAAASYAAPDNIAITSIKAKTDNLPSLPASTGDVTTVGAAVAALSVPTANQNADALLDRVNGIETGWTLRQASRIILSVLGGKASGLATTTATFRNVTDTTNRVVAIVDSDGNRTSVTLDAD